MSKWEFANSVRADIGVFGWWFRYKIAEEEAALNLMVAPHMYKRWESGERVPHISTLLKLESVAGIDWQAWMSVREGWQQVCP